jgi:hypothetical protein
MFTSLSPKFADPEKLTPRFIDFQNSNIRKKNWFKVQNFPKISQFQKLTPAEPEICRSGKINTCSSRGLYSL